MPKARFERGAVVRCNASTWIVWTYPPRLKSADPIAFPVATPTAPLHRSHVRLVGLAPWGRRPVIIDTSGPQSLPHLDCELIGQCNDEVVSLIADTMRRALAAREMERAFAIGA